jgi:hypothetical protein
LPCGGETGERAVRRVETHTIQMVVMGGYHNRA